ncbi:hypothetical protein [Thiocapsa rosea]|nr:hypothetical protein [Thiocapsa rosea]
MKRLIGVLLIPAVVFFAGALATSPRATAAEETAKNWFPGHYIFLIDGTYTGLVPTGTLYQAAKSNPYVRGYFVQYDWVVLEPTKGNYDFSKVIADLNTAQRDGKKLWVMVMDRKFNANHPLPVPQYIVNECKAMYNTLNGVPMGWKSKPYNVCFQNYMIALYQQLASAIDDHPALAGVMTEETSVAGIEDLPDYTHQSYLDGMVRIFAGLASAFEKGVSIQLANYAFSGGNTSEQRRALAEEFIEKIAEKNNGGIGTPDVILAKTPMTLREPFGFMYDKYQNVAPIAPHHQWMSYDLGVDPETSLNYAVDVAHSNFVMWAHRTDTTGKYNVFDVLNEITRQKGRINTNVPQNIRDSSGQSLPAPGELRITN